MKVLIVYFSGTGNTQKIAELYRKEFSSRGDTCDVFSLPFSGDAPNLKDYDLLGIGYPVHAFNAPKIVFDYVKGLERARDGMNAFIFKVSGEPVKMIRVSSLKLISLLKKRGYTVKNEYGYCMPYNIIFRHSDTAAYRMWETAKSLVPVDVGEIEQGVERKEKSLPFGRFMAWVMRIEHPGARFNGRFYKIKGDCISCGKCAKNCPAHNIEFKDGVPHFGKNCMMCMRCSFYCPKNCIKIGLFDGWRVNGEYSFLPPPDDEEDSHSRYCKKAYERYYREAEERTSK